MTEPVLFEQLELDFAPAVSAAEEFRLWLESLPLPPWMQPLEDARAEQ